MLLCPNAVLGINKLSKLRQDLLVFGAVNVGTIVHRLFAARLQSLPQRQAKDFWLCSGALGRLNIYLAFIAGEIMANVECATQRVGEKERR